MAVPLQFFNKAVPIAVDIPGTHGDDDITGLDNLIEPGRQIRLVLYIVNTTVTIFTGSISHQLAVDPFDGGLPRRIDIGHHQHLRIEEGETEVLIHQVGPGVEMRLKYRHDPALRPPFAGCIESHLNLGRVVRIVIDHQNVILLRLELEPAEDTVIPLQATLYLLEGDVQLQARCNGSQCVLDVVIPRRLETDRPQKVPLERDGKL